MTIEIPGVPRWAPEDVPAMTAFLGFFRTEPDGSIHPGFELRVGYDRNRKGLVFHVFDPIAGHWTESLPLPLTLNAYRDMWPRGDRSTYRSEFDRLPDFFDHPLTGADPDA